MQLTERHALDGKAGPRQHRLKPILSSTCSSRNVECCNHAAMSTKFSLPVKPAPASIASKRAPLFYLHSRSTEHCWRAISTRQSHQLSYKLNCAAGTGQHRLKALLSPACSNAVTNVGNITSCSASRISHESPCTWRLWNQRSSWLHGSRSSCHLAARDGSRQRMSQQSAPPSRWGAR